MAKLELRKKAAVDKEDYDTAKVIKAEMDKLSRRLTYPKLAAHIYIK